MKSNVAAGIIISLAVSTLASCQLIGLFRSYGSLAIETVYESSENHERPIRLTGTGPEGAAFEAEVRSEQTNIYGLLPGSWVVEARVYDESENMIAWGIQQAVVKSGHSTAITVNILDVTTTMLSATIIGPGEDIPEGRTETFHLEIDGGTGFYDYNWSLNGNPVGTESTYYLDGHTAVGSYDLSATIIDRYSGASTISEIRFYVVGPFSALSPTEDGFTLTWFAPENSENIASYDIYFRSHGDLLWEYAGTVDAEASGAFYFSPEVLPSGRWEFGITSVSFLGNKSEMHTSLDPDTNPEGGWYLSIES